MTAAYRRYTARVRARGEQRRDTRWPRWLTGCMLIVSCVLAGVACGDSTGDALPTDDSSLPQLAFTGSARDGDSSDIHVVDTRGDGLRRLTAGPDHDRQPAWSAATQQIAFVRAYEETEGWDIYVVNIDGSGLTNLTNNARFYEYPIWSPDGSQIAYLAQADDEPREWVPSVFVMQADGSNVRRLTVPPLFPTGPPSWSPDSVHFVVVTAGDTISIVRADGTDVQALTRGFSPSWSPDGSRIAFVSDFEGNIFTEFSYGLFVIDIDGSNLTELMRVRNALGPPAWSPDGSRIAISHDAPGIPEFRRIYVINSDGSGLTVVSHSGRDRHDRHDNEPRWSPTGEHLAFNTTDEYGSQLSVWVVRADGGGLVRVSARLVWGDEPTWVADGR